MDKSLRRQGSGKQSSGSFPAGLLIINAILIWLRGLLRLTEQEQRDAGIYLGDQHRD